MEMSVKRKLCLWPIIRKPRKEPFENRPSSHFLCSAFLFRAFHVVLLKFWSSALSLNAALLSPVWWEWRGRVGITSLSDGQVKSVQTHSWAGRVIGGARSLYSLLLTLNRSKAGVCGPLSASGAAAAAAAAPVERHRAAASALDRWTGWDVPAHLHQTRDRRRAAEACVSGKKKKIAEALFFY